MLLGVIVLNELATPLSLGEVIRRWTGNWDFQHRSACFLLKGLALNMAGREGPIERVGVVTAGWYHRLRDQRTPVRRTPAIHLCWSVGIVNRACAHPAGMEGFLAANKKRQVVAHVNAVLP